MSDMHTQHSACIGMHAEHTATNQMQATLDDACTLISIAFQCGHTHETLAKSLSMSPGKVWDKQTKTMRDTMLPASPIGVILAEVAAEIAEQRA